eukprot:CAMPEP_0118652302 /NCGR_PEP_ID=MMETSP0785-20121206/11245_1 /TAXON_ID=91992 /ORGANISM="Bolidomonas pacifica, Strain CCMP 1866" /LENGTH=81 /DNA_ID=CAMNT_0006544809 /DNA_START=36 /DNA_END=278 /DNA_ORIENTATION=+
MTDMTPNREEGRGCHDESGSDQGKSDNLSLKGNHDAEKTLSVSRAPLSESRVEDGSNSIKLNKKTVGEGTVFSHGQKGEGG